MLSRNRMCLLAMQNFKLMQERYMQTNLQGDNISVLMPFNQMCIENSDMCYKFASEAYKLFVSFNICSSETDFNRCYYQLAVYGAFLSGLVFAYNLKTKTIALYTTSYDTLLKMASQGYLKVKSTQKTDLNTLLQKIGDVININNGNIAQYRGTIQDGEKILAVRLDAQYVGTNLYFSPVLPKTKIDVSNYSFFPYATLDTAMFILNQEMQAKMLKITCGDKVRVVTKNYSNLAMIYGEARAKALLEYEYDVRVNKFFAPNVGASMYSIGVTDIDLTAVDKIQVVTSLADIDLSEIRLDMSDAGEFCAEELVNLDITHLVDFANRLGITTNLQTRDMALMVLTEVVKTIPASHVYACMKESGYFNLAKYKSRQSRYGDAVSAEQISRPNTMQEFETLMRQGIYKIVTLSRNGTYSSIVCTNNLKELSLLYGNDFYAKYESYGNRLRQMMRELKNKYPDNISNKNLCNLCNHWGTQQIYSELNSTNADNYTFKEVMDAIGRHMNCVEENKTVIKQNNVLTVRNCNCRSESALVNEYYKNIDIRSIKSIIRLKSSI